MNAVSISKDLALFLKAAAAVLLTGVLSLNVGCQASPITTTPSSTLFPFPSFPFPTHTAIIPSPTIFLTPLDTFTPAPPPTPIFFPLPKAIPLTALQQPIIEEMEIKPLEAAGWTSYIGSDWPAIFKQTGEYPIVSSIIQAQDGTLWFATKGGEGATSAPGVGIYHYDGMNWTHYSEGNGAPSNAFTLMTAAPDGSIWMASESVGLARFDGQDWTIYTTENGLPSEWIQSMAFAPDGALWVGTTNDHGAARFDGEFWQYFTSQNGLWGDFVGGIFVLPDGSLLFSSSNGSLAKLTRFDGQNWEDYPTPWTENGKYTADMVIAANGDIWFATELSGAYRLSANTWTHFDIMRGSGMYSIAVARDGSAWVGTGDGVARFDGTDWTTFKLQGYTGPSWTSSIVAAEDGSIWLACYGGIAHYVPSNSP